MERASLDEMIDELRKMLTPRIRSGKEVDRRTEVFRQIILKLEEEKRIQDNLKDNKSIIRLKDKR